MFNKPTTGLFGNTGNTSFGFGTQPSAGGLFGQSTAAPASTGGLFGGSNTFGSTPAGNNTGFSFGTATATVQPTLQTATGGGLFGSSTTGFGVAAAPQPQASLSLFGSTSQPMNGGAFGAQANPSGSLFGGSSFLTASGSSATGTVVKFVPVTGTDVMMKGGTQQNVATKLQCITGMKEYESKSLEELRLEDYSANRKGAQAQQQTGLGFLGGATSQSSPASSAFGLFGPPTKPTFTGFASTPSTGATSSLFGQTQPSAAGSLFGTTSQQKPLFGSAAATTSASPFGSLGGSTTLFGQNTTSKPGIFGATPATQSTSLFGSTPAATSNTSGFGSTGFGSGSTFGTTATSGALFGQKQTTGFATATPTSFSFGPSQPLGTNTSGGGLFGAKPAASSTGFGFGQPTNTGFTGFGTAATTGTLGANPLSFGTAGGTGLNMGGLSGAGTSLFQAPKPNAPTTLGFPGFNQTGVNAGLTLGNPSTTLCNTGSLGAATDFTAALLQQQQQIQQQLQVLNTSPYGDSPLFRNLKQDSSKKNELLKPTNPVAQKAMLAASSQLKVTGQPNYRIKPKPLQSIITGKGQLFDGLEEDESSLDRETFVPRRNFKKLVIKNTGGNTVNSRSLNGSESFEDDHQNYQRDYFNNSTGSKSGESSRGGQFGGERLAQFADQSEIDDTIRELHAKHRLIGTVESGGQPHDSYSDHDDDDAYSNPSDDGTSCHPTGITLRRPDYFTMPSLNELVELMDANGECVVENFVVGRDGYGNVVFPGFTNVAGLNLDEIVHFRSKEIDIYPNEENKPPFGEGLNKKAQVTLDRVWPVDKTTNEVIKDYDRLLKIGYLDRLEKASRKIGAKFIDYRHETGSWVFEVKHFSKYGLLDDSDDDEIPSAAAFNKNIQQQLLQPQQMKASHLLQKQAANQKQQEIDKAAAVEFELGGNRVFDRFAAAEYAVDEEDSEMPDIVAQDHIQTQSDLESEPQEELDVQSSFYLARSLGISAKQIQLQKASFFGSCEDEYMDVCQHDNSEGILQKIFHFDPTYSKLAVFQSGSLYEEKPLSKHHSWAEITYQEMPGSQKVAQKQESPIHTLLPSALSTCQKVQQAVQLNAVSYTDSVMADKQSLLMDLGLVNCRRSRVGWASGWNLAHVGQPLTIDEDSSKVSFAIEAGSVSKVALNSGKYGPKKLSNLSETSEVVIESLGMSEVLSSSLNIEDLMVEFLEVELMHSNHDDDANFPFFSPSPGVELLHSYSVKGQSLSNTSELGSLMSVTWNLCVALWGDLHLNEEFSEESYICHQARRNSLARWLTLTTEGSVEDEVQRNCAKGIEGSAIVFSYLSGGMIEKACEHALLCRDYHLALLIAQTTGSDDCKTMMQRQLVMWAETGMDKFINKDYLQLYSLLAGTLVWRSSEEVIINTCAGLDWKRCLALHLWFMCPSNATVTECLQEYERALQGKSEHGKYATLPRPLYMEKLGIEDEDVLDVCYHLLKLYSDRTHPLNVLLNPTTMLGNQLDYSLSWHLLQILNSLGYHHLSSLHHSAICSNYASQLESIGLWHWAVFVLLHIHDYNCRADAVRQMLLRHVAVEMQHKEKSKEEFIVNSLHVNAKWIHEAKAIKARAEGRYFEEAWHLLKAKKWNQCHAVVISSVAPEAIINENFEMLEALLKPLSDASVSSQIRDWNVGGGLYANYIEMLNQFHHMRHFGQVDNNVYELESLNELAASLSSLIGCMLSNNHIDSYCQAIMSKNITKVIDMLTARHTPLQYFSLSVDLLSSLALPEDFALETLAQMSHHALQAVLS